MKKIKLTKNKYAIVDDADFKELNKFKWYCSGWGYAVRDVGGRKNREKVYMHKFLNKTPKGFITDHINRDRLDNRRINLRSVNTTQSILNRGMNKKIRQAIEGLYGEKIP